VNERDRITEALRDYLRHPDHVVTEFESPEIHRQALSDLWQHALRLTGRNVVRTLDVLAQATCTTQHPGEADVDYRHRLGGLPARALDPHTGDEAPHRFFEAALLAYTAGGAAAHGVGGAERAGADFGSRLVARPQTLIEDFLAGDDGDAGPPDGAARDMPWAAEWADPATAPADAASAIRRMQVKIWNIPDPLNPDFADTRAGSTARVRARVTAPAAPDTLDDVVAAPLPEFTTDIPPRVRPPNTRFPLPPHPCPPGWVIGPPGFVGVGAHRCGTTWWHRQIATHPGVVYREGLHYKEVHFFDALGDRERLGPEEAARYATYFARPAEGGLTGEWTPRYMYDGWPLAQIAQIAPRARILVMLRDPVDRYESGFVRENRLALERGLPGITAPMVDEQRLRGLYAGQVERLLAAFPRDQVLILQYERCRADYDHELEQTYAFLGLDTAFRPPGRRNEPGEPRAPNLPAAERDWLARGYATDVARLVEIAPEIDPGLWPSVRDLL
jgi:hypothetical protein